SVTADADICKCSHCSNPRCTCTCVNENLCTCSTCRKMFDIKYDDNGNILSITICGYELSELQSINMERTYSADGNYLASTKNENGNTVLYDYNINNGILKSQTNAEGNKTNYTYNTRGELTKVETPVSNLTKGEKISTSYGYTFGNLTSIAHNDFAYYIEYDKWNNIERVSSNALSALFDSCSVAAYEYNTGGDHSQLLKITYGNGGTVDYTYDEYGRVIGISYDGGVTNTFEYTYDTLGNIISMVDNDTNRTVYYGDDNTAVYTEQYGLIYYAGTDGNGKEFEYSGAALYRTEQDLNGTKISAGELETYLNSVTDKFGRTSEKSIELRSIDSENENGYTRITTNYAYGSNNSNENAGKGNVKTISSTVTFNGESKSEYVLSYAYDKNGNITHEYAGSGEGRQLRYRYTYDEAEQLVRVDDAVQNKTYVYAYDKGGNRESEKTYSFTTGDTLGEVLETKISEYKYLVWKDRLSSFNGKTVQYNSAGNLTSYDGKTFTWEGRNLKEIALADGSKTQFEYDANGLRTQKRQYREDGKLDYYVDYIWEDGKLQSQYITIVVYTTYNGVTTAQEVGPFTSKVIYDASGLPQGFMINDASQFAFVRNLQGDVIAVVDQNGETVMEYSYDPWGNIEYHLSETFGTEQDAMLFTALCPLTYRGYNYDFTTGLYYLQSRYYNPEWGRFINCDDTNILLATQGETHNANLFAYCDNNPVNKMDSKGYSSRAIDTRLVRINIYSGAMGHADLAVADDLIFSYGAYKYYIGGWWNPEKWYKAIKGIDNGVLFISYNSKQWYKRETTDKNRNRTEYSFVLDRNEYINLIIFYIAIMFESNIEEPKELDATRCKVISGKYQYYKLNECNCSTVIVDALWFAAPGKVMSACYMEGLNIKTFLNVVTPKGLGVFARALSKCY
ncbi:MAG: hypothetical protein K2H01_02345, partial [Ruminococcus sp.]|nr:hypothetical protein [Ruminococcus sp.]